MAQLFNGQLNTNEIYNALFNMIISQRLFDITVATPTLAEKLKVDGTLYGDTKLYYSMDIGETYEWGNDAEAPNLLAINRNNTQKVEKITLDKFRQSNITVDNYLSKRAWGDEGVFAQFNGVLTASIGQAKKVFENGYINTYIGTHESTKPACNITVDRSDLVEPTTAVELESVSRITGQRISKTIADLFVELKDNNRKFNEFGFLRSYNPSELMVVWNAQAKNKILKIDLPMVFNKGGLEPMEGIEIDQHYFGDVLTTAGTADGSQYSLVEKTYSVGSGDNKVDTYVRIGEVIPTGASYLKNEAYLPNADIICKIISAEGNPFMSSMEVGTVFYNSRSLTENHYLTWGYNTMQALKEKPFISIKLGDLGTASST